MMSAKLASPMLLKLKVFQNKGYDVIKKILSHDQNNVADVGT